MATNFSVQTGTVFIKDFDEGVMRTMIQVNRDTVAGHHLGFPGPPGFLDSGTLGIPDEFNAVDEFDRADPKRLFMKVDGLTYYQPDKAPEKLVQVIFSVPEQLFTGYVLPSIVVRREDMTPELSRWHSEGALQYRVPSQQSQTVQVQLTSGGPILTGPTEIEQLKQAWPYDIPYTITAYARSRNDATALLQRILRAYQPYGRVFVRDSKGEVRTYEAFMEGLSPLDEVVDVTGRTVAYQVSLRVQGEMDSRAPEVYKTVIDPRVTASPLPPDS